MEVILQQDVDNLGTIGDVVKVKPGYARNYLFPRGLALEADAKNLATLEHRKRAMTAKRAKVQKANEASATRIASLSISITARAGEEDKLFGSVTNTDIQKALAAQGFEIERKKIVLDGPIKTVGEHKVTIDLGAGVRTPLTVTVVRQEEAPSESA
ncbi:MAG TPA: 50S ribosomal protein L9 [Candidatus Binatia bacterium]|nr:50S ribosomal protein L9 [Candidatus Binatia bacterium]